MLCTSTTTIVNTGTGALLLLYCSVCLYQAGEDILYHKHKFQRRRGGERGGGGERERERRREGEQKRGGGSGDDERRGENRMRGAERGHRRNGFSRPGRGGDCMLSGDRHGARETDIRTDRETDMQTDRETER